jgi:hypothetical protein
MSAAHENSAPYAMTALGWWRTDVARETSYAYWRDIHGTLAARIPGFYQYRQLHLAVPRLDLPVTAGIDATAPTEPVDGVAQMMFLTSDDLQTFGSHPFVTEHIFNDERNLVRRNATMPSAPGTARTLVDVTGESTPQGVPAHDTYAIMFQQAVDVDRRDFHSHIAETAAQWSTQSGVLRLRYTPLEPYDETGWQSPGVRHDWAPDEQYQAWLEIVVTGESALASLHRLDPAVVRNAHVYPVREKYTIVYDGRPTDVGLRGWPAVQTIGQAGATNQQAPPLLRALYGSVVDGVKGTAAP